MIEGHFDVITTRDPDQENWLKKRRSSGIGASESKVLLGLTSQFASPASIYAEKLELAEVTEQENELASAGKWMEEPILAEYARRTGRVVEPDQRLLRSLGSDAIGSWDFMTCTPDGLQLGKGGIERPGVVEAKALWWGDPWEEHVPNDVICQLQHQMAVTGFTWGTAVALQRGELVWKDIWRDDAFINDILVPCCREFWQKVVDMEPLPPDMLDGSKHTTDALKRMFPEKDGENEPSVSLSADFAELVEDRKGWINARDSVAKEIARIDNRFIAAIGENTLGVMPDGSMATYRTTHKQAEWPRGPVSFRQLRFKEAPK